MIDAEVYRPAIYRSTDKQRCDRVFLSKWTADPGALWRPLNDGSIPLMDAPDVDDLPADQNADPEAGRNLSACTRKAACRQLGRRNDRPQRTTAARSGGRKLE